MLPLGHGAVALLVVFVDAALVVLVSDELGLAPAAQPLANSGASISAAAMTKKCLNMALIISERRLHNQRSSAAKIGDKVKLGAAKKVGQRALLRAGLLR